jgi:hypothetical protein
MVNKLLQYLFLPVLLLLAVPAFAGTRAQLVEVLQNGIRDTSGNPCSSCKVYTYTSGTSTPKDTYTSVHKSVANANPVVLDSNGQATIYADGSYKFIITTSADVTLYTWDGLTYSFDALDTLTGLATAGSSTAYTLTITPYAGAYSSGMFVYAKAHTTSGASPTLNVSGLGAVSLVKRNGAAVAAGDITSGQIFAAVYDGTNFILLDGTGSNGAETYCGTSSGTNTITATCTPTPGALVTGARYRFKAGGTNTGATTLNLNSLGATNIYYDNGSNALNGGEIVTGYFYEVVYDGTQFRLVTPPTGWSSYTPTLATSGSLTLTSTSIVTARYRRRGLGVEVQIGFTGTLGGTASDTITFTLPFTAASNGVRRFPAWITDGGAVEAGHIIIGSGSSTAACKTGDSGNFTNSGAFECNSNFYYEPG